MSDGQEDLRERVEAAVTCATKEWDLSLYDVVGVLHTYMAQLITETTERETFGDQ